MVAGGKNTLVFTNIRITAVGLVEAMGLGTSYLVQK